MVPNKPDPWPALLDAHRPHSMPAMPDYSSDDGFADEYIRVGCLPEIPAVGTTMTVAPSTIAGPIGLCSFRRMWSLHRASIGPQAAALDPSPDLQGQ